MSVWRPITESPEAPTAAVLWHQHLYFSETEVSDVRQTCWKCELAFWDGECWVEGDSGHDVAEDWKLRDQLPTHWMAITSPTKDTPEVRA